MKEVKSRRRPQKQLTARTLLQTIYLAVNFTSSNDLLAYAASCAFGFLLSFIPVVMMILTILVRFMHTKTQLVKDMLEFYPLIRGVINLDTLIDSIRQMKKVTNFEVIVSIAIIWMARRFFILLTRSMRRIFKKNYRAQKGFIFLIAFAAEALLTIAISALIFFFVASRSLIRLSILDELTLTYPELMEAFSDLMAGTLPYVLMFIGSIVVYKFLSLTKPPLVQCIFPALGCTFSFWGFRKLMRLFINVNRYNTVYGVLSNAIVLLLEVYFFFIIFLFFAQLLFVNQFFDTLVMGELYTLPGRDDIKIKSTLKRLLFLQPDSLLYNKDNVIHFKRGSYVYKRNQTGTDSYYIVRGTVRIAHKNNLSYLSRGDFFGEESGMLDEERKNDALAVTDVELVRIPLELFTSLLNRNPEIAKESLSKISSYFDRLF